MAYERMANRYNSYTDLTARLHGTICRYKDVPVSVSVSSAEALILTDLVNGTILAKIKPDDPDFDISSPELGYFTYDESDAQGVIYVTRLPYRRFRQGLSGQSCSFVGIDGNSANSVYRKTYFSTEGFRSMLMKKYPSLEEAIGLLREDKKKEIAISQEVALQKTESKLILVYFRKTNIGWIKPNSNEVEITAGEFDWVIERYLTRVGLAIKEKVSGYAA